jgi:hypothetical protein
VRGAIVYKKILYKKAYRSLKDSTPLKFDCGLLCHSRCCSGDTEMGMCLYPGEEVMLNGHEDLFSIRKESLRDKDVLFAVCNGKCDRKFRPLACRSYPYVPYFDESGRLSVIEDPRARYVCPLLMDSIDLGIERTFKRNVVNAFRSLIRDEEIRQFIRLLSRVLDDYDRADDFLSLHRKQEPL